MPVKPGEVIDPAATRRRILEISERVFYERGIAAVGVADIAEAAGASKATIYKNFGSKQGLAAAALAYRSEHVRRWLEAGTAHLAPGRERVLGVFDLLRDWYAQDDFRGCAIVSAAAEQRVSNPVVTGLARRHLQVYRDFLTEILAEAQVTDPAGLAARLLILIEGATVISAIDATPAAGQQARELAIELLSAAERPQESPLPADTRPADAAPRGPARLHSLRRRLRRLARHRQLPSPRRRSAGAGGRHPGSGPAARELPDRRQRQRRLVSWPTLLGPAGAYSRLPVVPGLAVPPIVDRRECSPEIFNIRVVRHVQPVGGGGDPVAQLSRHRDAEAARQHRQVQQRLEGLSPGAQLPDRHEPVPPEYRLDELLQLLSQRLEVNRHAGQGNRLAAEAGVSRHALTHKHRVRDLLLQLLEEPD